MNASTPQRKGYCSWGRFRSARITPHAPLATSPRYSESERKGRVALHELTTALYDRTPGLPARPNATLLARTATHKTRSLCFAAPQRPSSLRPLSHPAGPTSHRSYSRYCTKDSACARGPPRYARKCFAQADESAARPTGADRPAHASTTKPCQ